MAIRFTDKPSEEPSRRPAAKPQTGETARAVGEARFATPIEAVAPVNADTAGELPFSALPRVEKAERKKRTPKPATRP